MRGKARIIEVREDDFPIPYSFGERVAKLYSGDSIPKLRGVMYVDGIPYACYGVHFFPDKGGMGFCLQRLYLEDEYTGPPPDSRSHDKGYLGERVHFQGNKWIMGKELKFLKTKAYQAEGLAIQQRSLFA
jgi:hypothetical protein